MKKLNVMLLLIFIGGTMMFTSSCTKEACDETECLNGGSCLDGTCYCPDGFSGPNCEVADIQALLDNGKTPLYLVNEGIPVSSLYGKIYEGGLIFYLDTIDGTGLVAATEDQGDPIEWGCYGTNISNLNDVNINPTNPETILGARVGDGYNNTNAILAGCSSSSAARRCAELSHNGKFDWFLPSREALNLMYTNLAAPDFGNPSFTNNSFWYWSSTELHSEAVWAQGVDSAGFNKDNTARVRAVRAF